jgi:type IV secretion system protein VirD4
VAAEGSSGLSGGELLFVVGVGVAASVGAALWAGAALAAAVASGEVLPAGFGDGLRAAAGLVSDPGHPAEAWPPAAKAVVPGAALYWSCTALVAAALVVVGVAGWRWWQYRRTGRVRLGVEVQARFARRADLAPLVVERPVPAGRFVLGAAEGCLVATEDRALAPLTSRARRVRERQGDRGSVAVIGPSRSGKTAGVIAGLLEWEGPAVVVSVKRDLIDATAKRRSQLGEVAVFDPSGVSGIDEARLARWSPLRAAATPTGALKAATSLAAAIPTSGVDGGMDYWSRQAEILLAGLLGAAALDPDRTMADVARWVFTKDMPVPGHRGEVVDTLMRVAKDPVRKPAAEAAMLQLDAVWKLDERVRTSVYATVQTVVQPWLDPSVDRSASLEGRCGWVDLDWLCEEGTSNTLYLVAPLDDQRRLGPVLGGLLGDLKDQAYQWDVAGRRLPSPLLLLVDEAGNMPLAWLPEVASTCAGIGIVLVTIWQSKAQLDAAYGRLADSVLTNHLTKIVFSGCSDPSTLDYVSRLLGEEEITRRSWSADIGGGTGRRSISEAVAREALSPYHLLRQVRPGEAVLIHGTLPPAHLHARRWWTDPHLQQLAGVDPGTRPGTGNRRLRPATRTRR